jgi:CheY-like chemotaxis protein
MEMGNRVVSQAAVVAAARPRPPSLDGQRLSGMTVEVLPDHDRLRVLIADDDADTADSLAVLLKLWGHEVWETNTGAEALEMAFRLRPDVLLLDVAMPDLDGFCLARAIRQLPFLDGVLLVAITGYADDAHRQVGMRAGFDHYLAKPVQPAVVEALLLLTAGAKLVGGTSDRDRTVRRVIAESPGRVTTEGALLWSTDR